MNENDDDLFDYNREQNPNPEIKLRYSREERLKNAPDSVKQMYDENYLKAPGIFKSLVATRSSRMLFTVIILTILIIGVFRFLPKHQTSIEGIKIELTCTASSDAIFAKLTFAEKSDFDVPDGTFVVVAFTALTKDGEVLESKRFETVYIGNELILTTDFKYFNLKRVQADILINDTAKSVVKSL